MESSPAIINTARRMLNTLQENRVVGQASHGGRNRRWVLVFDTDDDGGDGSGVMMMMVMI